MYNADIIYVFLLFAPVLRADDSYGTTFITAVLDFNNDNYEACNFMLTFQPSTQDDVTINIQYGHGAHDENVVASKGQAATYQDVCSSFDDVNEYPQQNQLLYVKDTKITITSNQKIKVFATYYRHNNEGKGVGDTYLVYPVVYAGRQYSLRLPTPAITTNHLISIIPLHPDRLLTGEIVKFRRGVTEATFGFKLASAFGRNQALYVSDSFYSDIAYHIYASSEFIVVAAVPCIDLRFESGGNPALDLLSCDSAIFMPFPVETYDCKSTLSDSGEIKIVSSKFTNIVYESPGSIMCGNDLLVNIYEDKILTEDIQIPTRIGSSYPIDSRKIATFSSNSLFTTIQTSRFGGERRLDNGLIGGAFFTNVPDMTQTLSGSTTFFTLSDMSYIELYGSDLVANIFKLDNRLIDSTLVNQIDIPYYGGKYYCFIITIKTAGSYTFYSEGNYVMYVIGKNNAKYSSNYGYLAGFRKSQLTTTPAVGQIYPGGDPNGVSNTKTPNDGVTENGRDGPITTFKTITTTKSSSIVYISHAISLLSIFNLLFV